MISAILIVMAFLGARSTRSFCLRRPALLAGFLCLLATLLEAAAASLTALRGNLLLQWLSDATLLKIQNIM